MLVAEARAGPRAWALQCTSSPGSLSGPWVTPALRVRFDTHEVTACDTETWDNEGRLCGRTGFCGAWQMVWAGSRAQTGSGGEVRMGK